MTAASIPTPGMMPSQRPAAAPGWSKSGSVSAMHEAFNGSQNDGSPAINLRESFAEALRNLDEEQGTEASLPDELSAPATAASPAVDAGGKQTLSPPAVAESRSTRRFPSPVAFLAPVQPAERDPILALRQPRTESKSQAAVARLHRISASSAPVSPVAVAQGSTSVLVDTTVVPVPAQLAHLPASSHFSTAQPGLETGNAKTPLAQLPHSDPASSVSPSRVGEPWPTDDSGGTAVGTQLTAPLQEGTRQDWLSEPPAAAASAAASRARVPSGSSSAVHLARQSLPSSSEPSLSTLSFQPAPTRTAGGPRCVGRQTIAGSHTPAPLAARSGLAVVVPPSASSSLADTTTSVSLKSNPAVPRVASSHPERDAFAALDTADRTPTPQWSRAGPRQAEAGYQDQQLGWVAVRAQMSTDGIHAALVPDSTAAAQALGNHLAGLNAHLVQEHLPVASLTLSAAENRDAGSAMGQGGGPPDGRSGQNYAQHAEAAHSSASIPRTGVSGVDRAEPPTVSGTAFRGGTYVSVMA